MMLPPGTSCPPNAFTPSRCAFESRPFLELPKPFLCAITTSLQLSAISCQQKIFGAERRLFLLARLLRCCVRLGFGRFLCDLAGAQRARALHVRVACFR